jgi:epsin
LAKVRVSAKELTSLILDEERLRTERQDRRNWKSRVTGLEDFGGPTSNNGEANRGTPRKDRPNEDEDLEYRLAIEASKTEAEEDAKRRAKVAKDNDEDADLAKAIKLSKEEEDLRRKELEEANATSLFDDTPTPSQPAVTQPTGWNQGYQQQPAVNWFGDVIDPQQQENTGYGLQGLPTGYQNGFGYSGLQQTQPTGYNNPNLQNFQGTGFVTNTPYNPQTNGFGAFGQPQQQQQLQQQQPQQQQQPDTLQPGSHNPFAATQQLGQDMKAQPAGSNNPFATSFQRPASAQPRIQPTLNSLQEQKATTSFNPITSYQAPQPQIQLQPMQQQQPTKPQDPHMARLNALLASGEGQDTFGNVGDLRIPAQHTAPGTFVNSAGAGLGRITQNATGNNPFLNNQFTGMPQQTGFSQNRVMPAQTGPAGPFGNVAPFGAGGNNPFSAVGGNQQQQHGQGGSLIDI